ncbi:MAG: hypothetical protein FWD83_02080 [Promicromonosporaceae bacterium]|nr:hypothetical protein [Promicromonosporaceae bacterium]
MFDNEMVVVTVDGWRCASTQWALSQAVPELDRLSAVACMDSALNQRLISPGELVEAHQYARGRRGVLKTHRWWFEANGRSESPLETAARLECCDHSIPPDALQHEAVDTAGIRRRLDLAWFLPDGSTLAAEIDGREFHDGLAAAYTDRVRQNSLIAGGDLTILRFTHRDLLTPGQVASTVLNTISTHRP